MTIIQKNIKKNLDTSEQSFQEALSVFKHFAEVASEYYKTKHSFLLKKNAIISQNDMNNKQVVENENIYAIDGYEENLLETFRKASPDKKRKTFHLAMNAMEGVIEK